jgi:hypothetical protein
VYKQQNGCFINVSRPLLLSCAHVWCSWLWKASSLVLLLPAPLPWNPTFCQPPVPATVLPPAMLQHQQPSNQAAQQGRIKAFLGFNAATEHAHTWQPMGRPQHEKAPVLCPWQNVAMKNRVIVNSKKTIFCQKNHTSPFNL